MIALSDNWKEQYQKMLRWKRRIQLLLPCRSEMDFINLNDFLSSFFIDCFHLRDWLRKNGVNVPWTYIADNEPLYICRGIANRSKHFRLKVSEYNFKALRSFVAEGEFTRVNSSTGLAEKYPSDKIPLELSPPIILQPGDCIVTVDGKQYNMLELVDDCISLWYEFLKSKGLLP